jgi:hypothetical protein
MDRGGLSLAGVDPGRLEPIQAMTFVATFLLYCPFVLVPTA